MKPAVINGQCRLYGMCRTCRESIEWRSSVNAPEICPHGITQASLDNPDGLGSFIEGMTKPFASMLPCYDEEKRLKPTSGCFKRREELNALSARKKQAK